MICSRPKVLYCKSWGEFYYQLWTFEASIVLGRCNSKYQLHRTYNRTYVYSYWTHQSKTIGKFKIQKRSRKRSKRSSSAWFTLSHRDYTWLIWVYKPWLDVNQALDERSVSWTTGTWPNKSGRFLCINTHNVF